MNLAVLKNLKSTTNLLIALGSGLLFFDLNYYLMANLPGTRDRMCILGANMNVANITYAVLMSLMVGVMVAGVVTLFRQHKANMATSTTGGAAVLIGTFTVFCTACTLQTISIFGLSIGLTFFTTYNILFKVISVGMMLVGMFFLNRQLEGECKVCKT